MIFISLLSLFLSSILPCFADQIYKNGSEPKVLVLIISSNNRPHYQKEEEIWREYMHKQKENVECYFIKSNPYLKSKNVIIDDVIFSKQKEDMIPGILRKTLLSFEVLLPRIKKEFDFVLRTNLSSFLIFPHLIEYLKTLPIENVFRGPLHRGNLGKVEREWASGFFMLFSSDVVEEIIKRKQAILEKNERVNDDVILSLYLKEKMGIQPLNISFLEVRNLSEYQEKKEQIKEDIFLVRAKNTSGNRDDDEIFVLLDLLENYYP